MTFDNSYARLPDLFFERIAPIPVSAPSLIRLNRALADTLGLDLPDTGDKLAAIFSGNELLPGSEPLAQAYAGHQFGGFVPQLGDGRAVMLGETVTDEGKRFDIQLKGSGRTRFSRGGDGRSPLGAVIREYVVSEAMHALGVPTTRALAMVATGEKVRRDTLLPGGIMTRVASSFIRIGTFEFFAARGNTNAIRQLADHAIARHAPKAPDADNPYAAFFESVCRSQAELMARWLHIGFIHGVMNTDNTTISGETIDYGPCAFMDSYNPEQVFSSIDHQGRYAYNRQPDIMAWNLACLGSCLVPLLHQDPMQAKSLGEAILEKFTLTFHRHYRDGLCRKTGLPATDANFDLAREFMQLMHRDRTDFTLAFRTLSRSTESSDALQALFASTDALTDWLKRWRTTLHAQAVPLAEAQDSMLRSNPAFIPRNHRLEEAIRAAEDNNDFTPTHRLVEVLANPFDDQPDNTEYAAPPGPDQIVHQTFCGT